MKVTYCGPSAAVTICATGDVVPAGGSVDVDAALGKQLVAQGWEQTKPEAKKAGARKATTATKKAATPAAVDPSEED